MSIIYHRKAIIISGALKDGTGKFRKESGGYYGGVKMWCGKLLL
jgi:hypothetical protein